MAYWTDAYSWNEIIKAIAEQNDWSVNWTTTYFDQLTAEQRLEVINNAGFYYRQNLATHEYEWIRISEGAATVSSAATAGGAVSSSTVAGSGLAAAEIVEEGGNVAVKPLAQTTTATGKTIKAGGSITGVNTVIGGLVALQVAGAVAKDWKTHNEWWNDLSDAVFQQGEWNGIQLDTVTSPEDYNWYQKAAYGAADYAENVMEVIQRRVDDSLGLSNYYTYMSAEDLAVVMQMLAAEGAFDPEEVTYPTPSTGSHLELEGVRSELFGYAKNVIAQHNNRVGPSVGTIIPSTYVDELLMHLLAQAPADYDSLNIQGGGVENDNINVTMQFFKGTDNGTVYQQPDGQYRASGFSGTAYVAIASFPKSDPTHPSITYYTRSAGDMNAAYGYFTSGLATYSSNLNAEWKEGGVPEAGIEINPDATLLTLPAAATVSDIMSALQTQFPDWWNEGFSQSTYDPVTGTTSSKKWLPVTIPSFNPAQNDYQMPNDYTQSMAQSGQPYPNPNPVATPDNMPWYYPYSKILVPTVTGTDIPSANPTPSSPAVVPTVSGSSNALWAVYNPTFSEVSSLGSYLWSSSIIDIIQKFFSNPMDAIISLHMVYCTPITGASQNIKLGYLDSGVSAKIVTNQYQIIDCGTITIPEYFRDVRDYSPYTKADIYLPFLGIRSVAAEDIIGCSVNIVYKIDVLTGAILCEIAVTKRGTRQILYTFAGNCSVQIPLTGGDRTRLLSGIISGVTAVGAGLAVGGAAGGLAGAVHSIGGLHNSSSAERTGNYSSNAGAMGVKKPYIILNRKEAYDPYNYPTMYGLPSNELVQLGSCKGYTRVKSIHLDTVPATQTEKTELEALLKEGVTIL